MRNSGNIYSHGLEWPMPSTANLTSTALCRAGLLKEALRILLTTRNSPLPSSTYFLLLHTCISNKAFSQGKQIHSHINHREFQFSPHKLLQNTLIRLYVECGCLVDARQVFDQMSERDLFSWNIIIAAYRRRGYSQEALNLFHQLQRTCIQPDRFTFASILPACAKTGALEQGMGIHQSIIEKGHLSDVVLASALVDMYAKCGNMHKAHNLFDKMSERNVVSWTSMIGGYVQNGFVEKAMETFKQMQFAGVEPNSTTFVSILPACAKMGVVYQGMDIHQSIMKKGFLSDVVVANTLVDMYAKCGIMHKAHELFDKMPERNVVSWTTMIAGYTQNGVLDQALRLFKEMPQRNVGSWNAMIAGYAQNEFFEKAVEAFKQMQLSGVKPDSTTFASVLPACAKMGALEEGMNIHQSIMKRGCLSDVVVGNVLLDMYAKCGSIHKACELFEKIPERNVVSRTAMIAGYAQNGVLDEAFKIFKEMPIRDVVSWNAMIKGYAQNGFVKRALEGFNQMQLSGIKPDSATFASVLPACAKMGDLEQGMHIHQRIIEGGFLSDVVVVSALIDTYAKCGSIHKAHELFDKMPQKNVFSWTAMIAGYTQNGFAEKAMEVFKQMQSSGVKPDSTTFASILPACAKMGALEQGMAIHQSILERGFLTDVVVGSALVDMYAKCGSIHKAHKLFNKMPERNVFSWTALIVAYAQNGFVEKAVEAFKQMQLSGVKPDSTTFASILPACAKMQALEQGMGIHQSIMEMGLLSDVVVANALVDMYAKCGSMHKARVLFDKMPERNAVSWTAMIAGYTQNGVLNEALRLFKKNPQRDVVSWNAMIAGYAQNGFVVKAVEAFKQMQLTGVKLDSTTFSTVLLACAKMGALEQGMDIHQNIIESGFSSDVVVAGALVDMYAKCGSIHKAHELFDKMPQKNVFSWTAMIAGYAINGFCKDALKLFELMKHSGTYPDHVSFACVLLACSHAGLVDEGCKYFNGTIDSYCTTRTIDHYVCMVDLLGRAGYLEETLNFIIKMPIKPLVVMWLCLLGACRAHKNLGLGVFTAMLLFELDPQNAATYVLLSNIYSEAGRWGEVQMVRRLMKDRGIKKIPGCSWIEGHKMVHIFCVGDISQPQT